MENYSTLLTEQEAEIKKFLKKHPEIDKKEFTEEVRSTIRAKLRDRQWSGDTTDYTTKKNMKGVIDEVYWNTKYASLDDIEVHGFYKQIEGLRGFDQIKKEFRHKNKQTGKWNMYHGEGGAYQNNRFTSLESALLYYPNYKYPYTKTLPNGETKIMQATGFCFRSFDGTLYVICWDHSEGEVEYKEVE